MRPVLLNLRTSLRVPKLSMCQKLSGRTIKFGATVTLIDGDSRQKKVWQIVGEPEADATNGKISVNSPVGRELIGKTKGATVEFMAPGGVKAYRIQKVEWLSHDPQKR